MQNADKNVVQWELLYIVVTVQSTTATLGDGVEVSCESKHTVTMRSSNGVLWYLPKESNTDVYTKTYAQMFIAAFSNDILN